ncbi:MAG: DUF4442 domain-containing protein [Candidatus Marinimicrobia bacterium]|nr:DUF4442 domain-containing protein [Candidatus Neomarinimicrobiota bacterium]
MTLNPAKYFLNRYHSAELKPNELKYVLNLWLPFLFNRIHIEDVSDDFSAINVRIKHTFWNRNPSKAIWGGAIFSAADPFFPIMLKQIALRNGHKTDFFTKATEVKYIKPARTDINFKFQLSTQNIETAMTTLSVKGKYEGWHEVEGVDKNGDVCIRARIQSYLRLRK